MCGIIGYWPLSPTSETATAFRQLFDESRIRGMHAYGLATQNPDGGLHVLRSFEWTDIPRSFDPRYPSIAHTRYCQSGDWHVLENNQPLVVGTMAVAMNGVIHMGTKDEYEAAFKVRCLVDNDSEIFLQRLAQGQSAIDFINEVSGSFAAVWLQNGHLYAGRNARRPLCRGMA